MYVNEIIIYEHQAQKELTPIPNLQSNSDLLNMRGSLLVCILSGTAIQSVCAVDIVDEGQRGLSAICEVMCRPDGCVC